ncbi:NAD(P)-dependent methylenetetrahydromethanopterin dehydrogenase [Aquabacter spiritensis]|uniref:Methylene-tetrahydromethanopterin dehydrogenase n=1 Tax=Aquabacter spiritensis TaxID=933073 RepID=A0A4R3LVV1_9HYPH|nr:NAD(P)-dependent methylenetetrahydromethanopterin dehydrogenase [Aquabacter spiritensis]TCT04712.1 methylene-tetrahydromethanopterin dehydrogenase [Aquabacter spiritensis]
MADAAPILHLISPLPQVSPFDVNMAIDAGFAHVAPYPGVTLEAVRGLTQDMMFSRPPAAARRTGLFIGGKDAGLALDMADAARAALLPPFEISIFPDPSGAFTTAAAMIALVERAAGGLVGAEIQVFGATGVVGGMAGVVAAMAGGRVTLVSHRDLAAVTGKAADFSHRFGVSLACAAAPDAAAKATLLPRAEILLCAGAAGVEILSQAQLSAAGRLKVAADVNAVPPAGIAGLDPHARAAPLPHGVGIGALAIGALKSRLQHALLTRMRVGETATFLGIEAVFACARELVE